MTPTTSATRVGRPTARGSRSTSSKARRPSAPADFPGTDIAWSELDLRGRDRWFRPASTDTGRRGGRRPGLVTRRIAHRLRSHAAPPLALRPKPGRMEHPAIRPDGTDLTCRSLRTPQRRAGRPAAPRSCSPNTTGNRQLIRSPDPDGSDVRDVATFPSTGDIDVVPGPAAHATEHPRRIRERDNSAQLAPDPGSVRPRKEVDMSRFVILATADARRDGRRARNTGDRLAGIRCREHRREGERHRPVLPVRHGRRGRLPVRDHARPDRWRGFAFVDLFIEPADPEAPVLVGGKDNPALTSTGFHDFLGRRGRRQRQRDWYGYRRCNLHGHRRVPQRAGSIRTPSRWEFPSRTSSCLAA